MLLSSVFKFVLSIFVTFSNFIIDNIADPLFNYILEQIPSFNNYLVIVSSFITDYFLRGAAFARAVFCNVTGFPVELFTIFMSSLLILFSVFISTLGIRLALNAIGIVRAGKGAISAFGGKSK